MVCSDRLPADIQHFVNANFDEIHAFAARHRGTRGLVVVTLRPTDFTIGFAAEADMRRSVLTVPPAVMAYDPSDLHECALLVLDEPTSRNWVFTAKLRLLARDGGVQ